MPETMFALTPLADDVYFIPTTKEELLLHLSLQLRAFRHEKNMSVAELAAASKVHGRVISTIELYAHAKDNVAYNIENYNFPDIVTILKLATVLRCSVSDLIADNTFKKVVNDLLSI